MCTNSDEHSMYFRFLWLKYRKQGYLIENAYKVKMSNDGQAKQCCQMIKRLEYPSNSFQDCAMVLEEQPEKVAEAFMIFAQVPCLKKNSWSVTKRPNKFLSIIN
jgi:hypothetical protein